MTETLEQVILDAIAGSTAQMPVEDIAEAVLNSDWLEEQLRFAKDEGEEDGYDMGFADGRGY